MSDEFHGIYKGVVVDNNDPESEYRVIVQIPAVLGNASSNWASPILPTQYMPRIGDIVWVQFVNGDPGQPMYQSRVKVTSEMIASGTTIPGSGGGTIADFSVTARKMKNNKHYLY